MLLICQIQNLLVVVQNLHIQIQMLILVFADKQCFADVNPHQICCARKLPPL